MVLLQRIGGISLEHVPVKRDEVVDRALPLDAGLELPIQEEDFTLGRREGPGVLLDALPNEFYFLLV